MLAYKPDIPDKKLMRYENARIVVVPVPYEKTTCYGKGTKNGPRAICEASDYVELYDEELLLEPYKIGIHTVSPVTSLGRLETVIGRLLRDKKIPIALGGEHSISAAPVRACRKFFKDLSVVQFDAHADLRYSFEGTKLSHACVMRRIYETGTPFIQIGIRSMPIEEAQFIKKAGLNRPFYAHEIHSSSSWVDKAIGRLTNNVYLTFDVDCLDSGIIPSTGTPQPGGLTWYQVTNFLRRLIKSKRIVGADFVELSPRKGETASDFAIAKLVYKLIGYLNV